MGITLEITSRLPPLPPSHLSLQVYPRFAEFITFGGATKHVLTNDGTVRIVIKIKCSNNNLYRVWPVFSFLDPGASRDLEVCIVIQFHISNLNLSSTCQMLKFWTNYYNLTNKYGDPL